jgi:catechol-2,3-dioxygenase
MTGACPGRRPPVIQCRRLAYAALTTGKIDELIRYYEDIVGLFLSHRDEGRAVLSTRQGTECIVLEHGEGPGLAALAFEISPRVSLEDAQAALARAGVAAEIRKGSSPSLPRVLALTDPNGTTIELFNAATFVAADTRDRGANALKLGHVASFLPEIETMTEFYVSKLGFRKSDWRVGRAMFLRCSPDHHTVNFFKGEKRLAHLAFEVKDFPELVRASDLLIRNNYPLDWGPARHTIGHNCACYHTNPDGIRIEFYAEMDLMKDEELGYFEPRPWHEDRPQRPRNWETDNSPRNKWIPGVP